VKRLDCDGVSGRCGGGGSSRYAYEWTCGGTGVGRVTVRAIVIVRVGFVVERFRVCTK